MEAWAALLQPDAAGPLILLALTLGLFIALADWLEMHLSREPFCHTLFHWLGQPLFRVVPLLLFLGLSANTFFGWNQPGAPDTVNQLFTMRSGSLLNVLFFASLLLSQLPVFSRLHAPVLLLQLILAFALLFHWQMQALGTETYNLLPPPAVCLVILLLSFAMHAFGAYVARSIDRWIEKHHHRKQGGLIAEEMLAVFLQSPALILYTRHLGQQAEWING